MNRYVSAQRREEVSLDRVFRPMTADTASPALRVAQARLLHRRFREITAATTFMVPLVLFGAVAFHPLIGLWLAWPALWWLDWWLLRRGIRSGHHPCNEAEAREIVEEALRHGD